MGNIYLSGLFLLFAGFVRHSHGQTCQNSTYGLFSVNEATSQLVPMSSDTVVRVIRLSEYPATHSGFVCSFSIYAKGTGDVHLLVLRPTGTRYEYKVIHLQDYFTSTLGYQTIIPSRTFDIQPGDEFGFMNMHTGVIAANADPGQSTFLMDHDEKANGEIHTDSVITINTQDSVFQWGFAVSVSSCQELCTTSSACTTAFPPVAPANSLVTDVGNPVVSGQFSPPDYRVTVIESISVPFDGYVCSFSAYFSQTGPVRFQFWRRLQGQDDHRTYTLAAEYDYTPVGIGSVEVPVTDWYQPIQVKAGDFLGFANMDLTKGSIVANIVGDDTGAVFDSEFLVFPNVGDHWEVRTGATAYKFSIAAKITEHPSLCPNYVAPTRCPGDEVPTAAPTTQAPTTKAPTTPEPTTKTPTMAPTTQSMTTTPEPTCPPEGVTATGNITTITNPIIGGDTSAPGWKFVVIEDLPLTEGVVCSFQFYMAVPGQIIMQVWRPDPVTTAAQQGTKHFILVDQIPYTATSAGAQLLEASPPIEVKKGDLMGFANINKEQGSLAVRQGIQFTLNRELIGDEQKIYAVGDVIDISVFAPSYVYSMGTNLAPNALQCGSDSTATPCPYRKTEVPTAAPTTPAPTTKAPTTPEPTTPEPTTPEPTTKVPTTQAPTTKAQTTPEPTTMAPTMAPTIAPTMAPTMAPTTPKPTTPEPTCPPEGVTATGNITTITNPIIGGDTSAPGWKFVVIEDLPLTEGVVCSFQFYMAVPGQIIMQVWRPDPVTTAAQQGTKHFILVDQIPYTATSAGAQLLEASPPIEVKKGDLMGFANINKEQGSLAVRQGIQFTLNRELIGDEQKIYAVGDVIDISVFAPSYVYSMGTNLAPNALQCGSDSTATPCPYRKTDAPTAAPEPRPTTELRTTPDSGSDIGNPSNNGKRDDDHRWVHILKKYSTPTGTLMKWNAYLKVVVPVTVQIYRPTGTTNQYKLIVEETFIPTAAGAIEVYPTNKVELQRGDKVGFISEGFGTIAYNDGDEEVQYKNLASNGAPLVGNNVMTPNIINRVFSLSVTVEPFDPAERVSDDGGNEPVINGDAGLPYNQTCYILVEEPLSAGKLFGFRLYAKERSPIKIQVWKPSGSPTIDTQDFTLKQEVEFIPPNPGHYRLILQTPLMVDGDEYLGITVRDAKDIATTNKVGNVLGVKELGSSAATTVGQTMTVREWVDGKRISVSPDVLRDEPETTVAPASTQASRETTPVDDNVIGFPAQPGSPSNTQPRTYIMTSEEVPRKAKLVSFKLNPTNTNVVYLQIWRKISVVKGVPLYSLRYSQPYTPTQTGSELEIAPSEEVILQSGDLIGFTQNGSGTVAVNYISPSEGYRYDYKPDDGMTPMAGDQLTEPSLAVTDIFSYSIVIADYVPTDAPTDAPTTAAPTTPAVTSAPKPKTSGLPPAVVTTGNPVIPGKKTRKESDIHVLLDYQFELPYGVVCYFDAYMVDTQPANFQVWRRNTSSEFSMFTLMDEENYMVDAPNKQIRVWVANRTINGRYAPLRFQQGDYFGFTSIEQDAVGYNFGGNVPGSRTLFRKLDRNDVPQRGDNYEVAIKFLVYKFSLSVTYATHVDLCYDQTTPAAPQPTPRPTQPPVVRTTPVMTQEPGTPGSTPTYTDSPGAVYKVGNPSLPGVTMRDGTYSVVFDTFNLLQGYLCYFEGYFTEMHHTLLQIWRPKSLAATDRTFQLVTSFNFTPSVVPGANRAYPGPNDNVKLFANDKFGFTTDKKSVLAFKFGQYAWTLQAKMPGLPTVGGVYDINVRFHPYNISLSVTVATQKEWCNYVQTTAAPQKQSTTQATEAPAVSTPTPATPATSTPEDTETIGNPMDKEPKLPGEDGDNTFVMSGFNLTEGYLFKFNVFLNTTEPVTFQIFRPDPVDPNILNVAYEIGPFQAPYAPGVFEVYANPPANTDRRRRRATAGVKIQAGDKFGFTVKGGNPLVSTSGGSGSGIIVVPSTGGAINLSNGQAGGGSYILNVEVSEVPLEIPTTVAPPTTVLPPTTMMPTSPPSTAVNFKYVGNEVLGGGDAVFAQNRIYVLEGYDLPAGWVYRFEMHLSTTDKIMLQIWRPNPLKPSEVTLVGEMKFYAMDGAGLYSAYPNDTNPIAVQQGDKLGFGTIGINPLHAKQEQDAGSYVGILDMKVIGKTPAVGESHTFTGLSFSDKFPIAVEISSSYIPPPSAVPLTFQTKGNALSNGTQGPDGTSTYILDKDLADGFLYKFNVILTTVDPVRLQVFRPLGGTEYRLIGEIETLARYGPGEYRIYPQPDEPVAVKATDRIGYTTIVTNPLTYQVVSDSTVNTIKNIKNPPSVGDSISTTGVDFVFQWAFNVEIASRYIDPPVGPMGAVGLDGPAGAKGAQGEQGTKGVTGLMGISGDDGPRGLTGAKGPEGDKGLNGGLGDVGLTGSSGAQGLQGDLGAGGVTGQEGPAGFTGPNGPRGVTGAQGSTGLQGYVGVVGPQGVAGPQGDQGDQGPAGDKGAKGDVGDVGPVQSVSCAISGCQHVCTELVGAFECSCNPGFALQSDGKTCADINECNTDNGLCQQTCANDAGSATCTCNTGYNVSANGRHCDDLNECLQNPCGVDSVCLNLEGGYICYKGTGSSMIYNDQGKTAALATTTTFLNRNVFIGLIVWMILVSLASLLVIVAMMFRTNKKKNLDRKMQMQQSMRGQGSMKRANPDYALPEFTEIYDR